MLLLQMLMLHMLLLQMLMLHMLMQNAAAAHADAVVHSAAAANAAAAVAHDDTAAHIDADIHGDAAAHAAADIDDTVVGFVTNIATVTDSCTSSITHHDGAYYSTPVKASDSTGSPGSQVKPVACHALHKLSGMLWSFSASYKPSTKSVSHLLQAHNISGGACLFSLLNLGGLFVQEVPLNNERQPDLQQGVIACCSAIHQSVERNSLRYFEELRRHNYVS